MSDTCINGRINPSPETKLRLFADAAGHCSRPNCHRYLFSDKDVADYHIGEMAHIIAASAKGPRSDKDMDADEKAEYDNLILLCPSCHTEIDKAPDIFTVELVQKWKAGLKKRIIQLMGIPQFGTRFEARTYVAQILRANRVIFESLNPNMSYRENPEAEEAVVWKRKMKAQLIPNNQKILLFLEINTSLLNEEELDTVEVFRQHVDDLVNRHINENMEIGSRFPERINNILQN